MTPLIETNHTASLLLSLTAGAFAASELSIRLRSARQRDGAMADRGSIVAVVASMAVGVVLAIWSSAHVHATTIPGRWVPVVLGLALMWAGILLREWAVATLGRFFTVVVRVAEGQTVVDRGPYRWARHPSYTGLMVTLVGVGFALGSWLSVLVLLVLPLLGLVVRIRVEERALLDGLGEPYREYAARHRRLVPGIW